jgi:hypothetical protein
MIQSTPDSPDTSRPPDSRARGLVWHPDGSPLMFAPVGSGTPA